MKILKNKLALILTFSLLGGVFSTNAYANTENNQNAFSFLEEQQNNNKIYEEIDDLIQKNNFIDLKTVVKKISPEEAIVRLEKYGKDGVVPVMWILSNLYQEKGDGFRQESANWLYSGVLGTRYHLSLCKNQDQETLKKAEYKILFDNWDVVKEGRKYQKIRNTAIENALNLYKDNSYKMTKTDPNWICSMIPAQDGSLSIDSYNTKQENLRKQIELFENP